jgi:Flp pilus assembly protein TadD
MHKLIGTIAIAALYLSGCRSTEVEESILLSSNETEAVIYSTNDQRTTLNHDERTADLVALKKRLLEHVGKNKSDLVALGALAQVNVALGDLNAAENVCRTILRKDLKSPMARKILGQIALRRGQHDLALIHFTNIGGVNSKDASVINMLAQIELFKGNNNVAMSLFKKAIRLDPNDNAARMNLGVLYIKHRQMGLAAVEFERVIKAEPKNLEAKIHLAIVMMGRGEIAAAKELLVEVLSLDGDNPLVLYNLAVAAKLEKDFDDAIEYLKQYIASKRGKAMDNNQAFALINKIQRAQAGEGSGVSDEEIQEMAKNIQNDQKSAKNQRSSQKNASKVAHKSPKETKATKKSSTVSDFEGDSVSELEQALK